MPKFPQKIELSGCLFIKHMLPLICENFFLHARNEASFVFPAVAERPQKLKRNFGLDASFYCSYNSLSNFFAIERDEW
jgi:hypothetical protein